MPRKGRPAPPPKIDVPVPNEWRRWKYRGGDELATGNQMTDAAYRRGYHAATAVTWKEGSDTQNPYPARPWRGGQQYDAWEAGWKDGRAPIEAELLRTLNGERQLEVATV